MGDVDVDRLARRLERVELALQERRRHVAVAPRLDAAADQLEAAAQMDDRVVRYAVEQPAPIGFLEG
jgi:hypothetical protein